MSNRFINKEGRLGEFEKGYEKVTNQKLQVLSSFDSVKLEEMLRSSQKNVAQQVVSILINCFEGKAHGLLPEIEERLNSLGVNSINFKQVYDRRGLKTSDGPRKTFYPKPSSSKENFLRDENKSNCQDTDNGEDERWERNKRELKITSMDSKQKFQTENKTVISKQINESGNRIVITTK